MPGRRPDAVFTGQCGARQPELGDDLPAGIVVVQCRQRAALCQRGAEAAEPVFQRSLSTAGKALQTSDCQTREAPAVWVEFGTGQRDDARQTGLPARRFKRTGGRVDVINPRPMGSRLDPVEQPVCRSAGLRRAQQCHDACGRTCGGKLPAGFIANRNRVAFQQGAHASNQNPVLRHQRDRPAPPLQVAQYLSGSALRLVFKVLANGERRFWRTRRADGAGVQINDDTRGVRRRGFQQIEGQCVAPTGADHEPCGGLDGKQRIGGGRCAHGGPFEGDPGQRAVSRTETVHRRQRFARTGPISRPRVGPMAVGARRKGVRCLGEVQGGLREARGVAPLPLLAPGLPAQHRQRVQGVGGDVERQALRLG